MRQRNQNQQSLQTATGNTLPRPSGLKVITKPMHKFGEVDTSPSSIHLPLLQSPLNGSSAGNFNKILASKSKFAVSSSHRRGQSF